MATPSPMPTEPAPAPAPVAAPPVLPAGPRCGACGEPAVVNWRRRLARDELAHHVHAERGRRDEARLLADPQMPEPQFGPLPTAEDTTRTVYACGPHAIHMDTAALIHQGSCTAPNEQHLPDCDCTPEPYPEPEPEPEENRLPAHWQTGNA